MEPVKIYCDAVGNTLTIWFGDPADEDVSTQVEDGLIVMKDKSGRPIGIEKLSFASQPGAFRLQFETLETREPQVGKP